MRRPSSTNVTFVKKPRQQDRHRIIRTATSVAPLKSNDGFNLESIKYIDSKSASFNHRNLEKSPMTVLYTPTVNDQTPGETDNDFEQNSNILHLYNASYETTPYANVVKQQDKKASPKLLSRIHSIRTTVPLLTKSSTNLRTIPSESNLNSYSATKTTARMSLSNHENDRGTLHTIGDVNDRRKHERRRRRPVYGKLCPCCSLCCCLLSILALALFLAGLAALITFLITNKSKVTTTTTSTTTSTSTTTTATTTTSTSTSTSSTTSTSTSTTSSTTSTSSSTSSTSSSTSTSTSTSATTITKTTTTTGAVTVTITSNTCTSSWTGVTLLYHCDNCPAVNPYKQYNYTYVAIASQTRISFAFREDNGYYAVDDISVRSVLAPNTELVVNGGFEANSLSSWLYCNPYSASAAGQVRATSDYASYGAYTYTARSGLYYYRDGAVGNADYLSQLFATTIGESYIVSFWFYNQGSGTASSADVLLSI